MRARTAFAASVAAYLACYVAAFVLLPDRVPTHFGASGVPDRWGSRGEALLLFAVLGFAMAALFVLLSTLSRRLPASMLNLPRRQKEWWLATPARSAELRRRFGEDAWVIGALTMLVLTVVLVETVRAARSGGGLGWVFVVAFVSYLIAVAAWCGYLITRRYAPAPGDS